jgi:DNA modification methylase
LWEKGDRVNDAPLEQLTLFGKGQKLAESGNGSKGGFGDPSFAVNKQSRLHRWVPWIAGFSRDFVQNVLQLHLQEAGTVLDPFAGVGTTLVEAVLAGHDAVGFEINPYAAFVCRTKLSAYHLNQKQLLKAISQFESFYTSSLQNGFHPKSCPPEHFASRVDFFSPKVLRKVLTVMDFLRYELQSDLSDVFRLALGSTLVGFSNYSYEPSLSTRKSAGKKDVLDHPVGEEISAKLRIISEDIRWFSEQMPKPPPSAVMHTQSFFDCKAYLKASSIDLVVTSPPYLNNYHYNRNTRPHLYWLDFIHDSNELSPLEHQNFGKFWQTVRAKDRVDLDFPSPPRALLACLDDLRERGRGRGVYGGNGWANYAASYFNDCYRFAVLLKWVLRRRRTALVVIGNNILQGIAIPTDQYLAQISESVGLEVEDIIIPRSKRIGNSIIRSNVRVESALKADRLYEAVVVLRKR